MTAKTAKKLHIVTHGCQMNEYDSARMQDLLGDSHAMVPTDNAADADVRAMARPNADACLSATNATVRTN